MPKSWSNKKKKEMDGQPHRVKPDLDNIVKAFKDSLCEDDSFIHTYQNVRKIWGEKGCILIHR
jgi:Holliday junction resolvase RusA-like endonuclease